MYVMFLNKINVLLPVVAVSFLTSNLKAQSGKLTLEQCYALAKQNYPVVKKLDLINKSADYTIRNANKKFLPQLNISGQAIYQSQVVDYGALLGNNTSAIGIAPPEFSKDQYRVSGEVEQLLYDGGNVHYQNELTKANTELQVQGIKTQLYQVNERINNIVFSVFLLGEQLELNNLKIASLQTQLDKTEAAYKYGTAYASDVNELKAEIESTKLTNIDYAGNRQAYLKMLSILIGQVVADASELAKPEPVLSNGEIRRPELEQFNLQKNLSEIQSSQLKSAYLPTLKAFFQGAYGRPTLNPVSNDFGAWYITGLRLNWNLGNLYTVRDQRNIYKINSQTADVDRESFLQSVKLDMAQQEENVSKYGLMIDQDNKTIVLREAVTKSASAQLANGVITVHEYIQKLNNENVARQNLKIHELQLLQAQYNLKFKSGN